MVGSVSKLSPNERMLRKRVAARLRQRRCRERKREAVWSKLATDGPQVDKNSKKKGEPAAAVSTKEATPVTVVSVAVGETDHVGLPSIFRSMPPYSSNPMGQYMPPPPALPSHVAVPSSMHSRLGSHPPFHHQIYPPAGQNPTTGQNPHPMRRFDQVIHAPQFPYAQPAPMHHHHQPMSVNNYSASGLSPHLISQHHHLNHQAHYHHHHRHPYGMPMPQSIPRVVSRTSSDSSSDGVTSRDTQAHQSGESTQKLAMVGNFTSDETHPTVEEIIIKKRPSQKRDDKQVVSAKKSKKGLASKEQAAVFAMLSLMTTSSSEESEDGTSSTEVSSTGSDQGSPVLHHV